MGRKTKYKDNYPSLLREHMKNGDSYTSFASRIGVHIDTLYEWEKVYPEFTEAKKESLMHSQAFWEDIGKKMAQNGNFQAWKMNMINRFAWRDKPPESQQTPQEIRLAYKIDKPKIVLEVDEDDMEL